MIKMHGDGGLGSKVLAAACGMVMLAGGCGSAAGPGDVAGEGEGRSPGYERQVIYVSAERDERIDVFAVESETGELSPLQQVELSGSPGALAVSADRRHLYASVRSERAVATLAIDGEDGRLTLVATEPIGSNAVYLATEQTEGYLLSADYGGASVAVHALDDEARVMGEAVVTQETDRHAHAIVLDDAERHAFVPHTGPSAIYGFRFDASTGDLEPMDPEKTVVPDGAGPRHFRFHPQREDRAYSVNELDSSVTVFGYDGEAGTLSELQNLSTLPADFEGTNTCAEIHLTPDGRFLYATNRGHDSVAAYAVDGQSGELALLEIVETEPRPRGMAVGANGRFLYAAGKEADRLAAYAIDGESGRLRRVATYETGERPAWVEALGLN